MYTAVTITQKTNETESDRAKKKTIKINLFKYTKNRKVGKLASQANIF